MNIEQCEMIILFALDSSSLRRFDDIKDYQLAYFDDTSGIFIIESKPVNMLVLFVIPLLVTAVVEHLKLISSCTFAIRKDF